MTRFCKLSFFSFFSFGFIDGDTVACIYFCFPFHFDYGDTVEMSLNIFILLKIGGPKSRMILSADDYFQKFISSKLINESMGSNFNRKPCNNGKHEEIGPSFPKDAHIPL